MKHVPINSLSPPPPPGEHRNSSLQLATNISSDILCQRHGLEAEEHVEQNQHINMLYTSEGLSQAGKLIIVLKATSVCRHHKRILLQTELCR
jgi:hypothetical protein